MQIGIDLGASKIESVVLDEQGNEKLRERVDCPKNYNSIIKSPNTRAFLYKYFLWAQYSIRVTKLFNTFLKL